MKFGEDNKEGHIIVFLPEYVTLSLSDEFFAFQKINCMSDAILLAVDRLTKKCSCIQFTEFFGAE